MIFLLILISSLTHVQSTNETSLYLCFMLPQWNGSSWSLLPFSTTSNLPSPGHNIFLGHLQRLSHYSTHSHLFLSEDICSSLSQLRTSVLPNTLGKFTCTSNHKFLTSPKIFLVHHQFVLNPEFSSFTVSPLDDFQFRASFQGYFPSLLVPSGGLRYVQVSLATVCIGATTALLSSSTTATIIDPLLQLLPVVL